MKFHLDTAEVFVPDGLPVEQALRRTTHMAISAHQDDIEIMAARPILECFQQEKLWFTGVVITDGRGSPRNDLYNDYDDEQMHGLRFKEQKKAAVVGEYAAQVLLDYPSKTVKDQSKIHPLEDLVALLSASQPQYVYTHNLADKHDTHVAVALRTINAICGLPPEQRPQKLFGCEVWRDLDWMVDSDKVALDMTSHENLQAALLGVFDSQICGGKRYDLATMGRRRAHATYFESHGVDQAQGLTFAMDLTPLIQGKKADHEQPEDIAAYVQEHIARFEQDVLERLKRVG